MERARRNLKQAPTGPEILLSVARFLCFSLPFPHKREGVQMKHLLSLEKMSPGDMKTVLQRAAVFKRDRATHPKPLAGQSWAMLFSKSSTRTRVSFEVGIRELGGQVMFLNANDIQLGRGEP